MDPLSEVLALLNPQRPHFAGLRAGGDWAMHFPPPDGIKFNAVLEGNCWLDVDGLSAPVHLQAGDCFLLTRPNRFRLGSDLTLDMSDAQEVYRDAPLGVAHIGSGHGLFLIGGRFAFGEQANLLLDHLPPVILVRGDSEQASILRWALHRLAQELPGTAPGASLMVEQLGQMMLIQVLRLHLEQQREEGSGWLSALGDHRIGAAIRALHKNPTQRWTLEALAREAAVSRSTLALLFKQKVGMPPLEYLLRWRMNLAARELRQSKRSVSAIAESLGYEADSAFSSAFKRITGSSPRAYRQQHGNAAANE